MRRTVNIFIVALSVAVPAMAQDVQPVPPVMQTPAASRATTAPQAVPPVSPSTTPAPGQRGATTAPPAQAAAAPHVPDPRIDQSDVNIKLTVKITDTGSGATQTKTVSLIMANKGSGRVRSSGTTTTPTQNRGSDLNVDANVSLFKSGLISTGLIISYTPEWTDEATKMTGVSQQVTLFLKDGAPMMITQAADPTKGSRSVSIEVTASVLR